MNEPALRLGLAGAGRFGAFLVDSWASLPSVSLTAVADARPDAARTLAERHGVHATSSWRDLVADPAVDVVVVASPPDTHAPIAMEALDAGKHVFCEKPLAVDQELASDLVHAAHSAPGVLVVDHVLRYNPLLRAVRRLQDTALLGPVQRFCFENDASDEDLSPEHWFWDSARSGGIFVEHGVHFFDAAALLIEQPPTSVQAVAARRPGGPVDLVSATVLHGADTLATHTHSFTHAHRCERQLLRLDCGAGEVRLDGWIPVQASVDAWTDDRGLLEAERLARSATKLLEVDCFRLPHDSDVASSVRREASTGRCRARGRELDLPHHVRLDLTLGGHAAKPTVYAESVRAAMHDLVTCAATGRRPASGAVEGAAAVAVAAAATRSARLGTVEPLSPLPVPVT